MNYVEIEIEIDEDQYEMLERIANDEEITIEELINDIIREYLDSVE